MIAAIQDQFYHTFKRNQYATLQNLQCINLDNVKNDGITFFSPFTNEKFNAQVL